MVHKNALPADIKMNWESGIRDRQLGVSNNGQYCPAVNLHKSRAGIFFVVSYIEHAPLLKRRFNSINVVVEVF